MSQPQALSTALRHRKKLLALGPEPRCAACGESDLRVLQQSTVVQCAECRLATQGRATTERHHPAGRHNDDLVVPLPANPHAALSDAQYDWPRATLRNPDRDPLRTLAAWLRFFADTFRYLGEQAHHWALDLERYADYLTTTLGPHWWTRGN